MPKLKCELTTEKNCSCHLRWELGSSGPLCDYIYHFLVMNKKKSILVEVPKIKDYNPSPHKDTIPEEYIWFIFTFGHIKFVDENFDWENEYNINPWSKAHYIAEVPFKKIEGDYNHEYWHDMVYLHNYEYWHDMVYLHCCELVTLRGVFEE